MGEVRDAYRKSPRSKKILNKVEASAHQISRDLAFTTMIPGHISGKQMKAAMLNGIGMGPEW